MKKEKDLNATFIIADNQDITRAGLHCFISKIAVKSKITDVFDKKELLQKLMSNDNNVIIIIDYTLFDINGAEELLVIEKRFPESKWLLFSNELSEKLIRRLSVERNISMLLKENSGEEIDLALKYVLNGERYLCHQITDLLLTVTSDKESRQDLTAAETEILKLIARGKTVKEIAALRSSSIHTIVTHKKNIFRKLEVNNVYEATKYALRAGLIEMSDYYI